MKKNILFLVLILLQLHGFSANIALLISLQGEGKYIREGVEQALKVSQTFQTNDKIVLKSGKAVLMYFSGNEVTLSSGTEYKVVEKATAQETTSLYAMANSGTSGNLLSQSGNIYSIRGMKHVFPSKSKVAVSDSLVFISCFDNLDSLELTITFKESKMQKVVYSGMFPDTILTIKQPNLEVGKTYHWTISGTPQNVPELGTLMVVEVLPNSYQPTTRAEYIQAICDNFSSSFYIRSLCLCIEAKAKYPDTEIFNLMYENLLM